MPPIDFVIDSARDTVFVTITGRVGMDQWVMKLESILSSPEYRVGMSGLIDIREAEHITDIEDIARMAKYVMHHRKRIRGSKIAIAVTRTVSYGLMRMLQTQLFGPPFDIFPTERANRRVYEREDAQTLCFAT